MIAEIKDYITNTINSEEILPGCIADAKIIYKHVLEILGVVPDRDITLFCDD